MNNQMDNSDFILDMCGITKEFPGVRALEGVDLAVRQGEILALCGENGAGKSTLMKVLSGVYPHGSFEGKLLIDGKECRFRSTREAEGAGVAIIHQELNLVSGLSVGENIFLGREPAWFGFIDWHRLNRLAAQELRNLGIDLDPRRPVRDLSVGQRQLVEITKALSLHARILVLDEPTSALTEREAQQLFILLDDLQRQGVTLIYISHKLDEIFRLADRVAVLRDGTSVGTYPLADLTRGRLVALMVGRELTQLYPKAALEPGEEVLRVEGWCVDHPFLPGERIVAGVGFTVRQREVLGIAGLMGSGRSELVTSLFGAFPAESSGNLFLNGRPVSFLSPRQAMESGLALVTEDRKNFGLILEMAVGENLTLACLRRLARGPFIDRRAEAALVNRYIRDLRIKTASPRVPVAQLSGGNQQKVVLAKWLAIKPAVLILDEPTRGVDVGAKAEIYELMNELAGQGMAIVMVSSDLPEVLGMSDRILVMHEGRPAGELSRAEATQERVMQLATGSGR